MRPDELRVVLVTSWPTRWCGIASYSVGLARGLRSKGIRISVVCHADSKEEASEAYSCAGPRGEPMQPFRAEDVEIDRACAVVDQADPGWYVPVQEEVDRLKPDLVHIQHEFGLYSLMRRKGIYQFLPEDSFAIAIPMFTWNVRRLPVVITFHSVFSGLTYDETLYYHHMVLLAHAAIVHEPYQKDALEEMVGRPLENVHVCPHGTLPRMINPETRRHMRERWGVGPSEVVAGMMGWWEPNKGFERVIRVWPSIAEKAPEAVLVVAGEVRPGSPTGPEYQRKILEMIEQSPVRHRIRVELGRFSEEEYRAVMGSFDFLVLPYTHASQSGNHAHAYGLGVPAVASAIEGLKSSIEASDAGLLARDDEELEVQILKMLRSDELRARLSENAWKYARDVISWSRVAEIHREIYLEAKARARDPSRYEKFLVERVHV